MTVPPPRDRRAAGDQARKTGRGEGPGNKIDVERATLEYETHIDRRIKTRADAGAKPPYEIRIDHETPGIGAYYSDLTLEDFETIKQRIETGYKESGWEDVYCEKCEDQFIVRLKTAENIAEEEAGKKARTRKAHCFIATAVYGDPNHRNIEELERFRDVILKRYFAGRVFVKLYNSASPSIAGSINPKGIVARCIRKVLDWFVDRYSPTK